MLRPDLCTVPLVFPLSESPLSLLYPSIESQLKSHLPSLQPMWFFPPHTHIAHWWYYPFNIALYINHILLVIFSFFFFFGLLLPRLEALRRQGLCFLAFPCLWPIMVPWEQQLKRLNWVSERLNFISMSFLEGIAMFYACPICHGSSMTTEHY